MKQKIFSPITHQENIRLVKELETDLIIQAYYDELGMDVSNYFSDLNKVQLYECLDSGFRFYIPLELAGNDKFYEELGKRKSYYREWRWEHQFAFLEIEQEQKILELGCGPGMFLDKLKAKRNCDCVGLELNKEAAKICQSKGLNVLVESIQDYAKATNEKFDVVCSFQVMEHVTEVKEIIEASISLLKKNGRLIIAVPNNNPYMYKHHVYDTLNLPPHHIGLWDSKSLESLQKLFNITLTKLKIEPLEFQQSKPYFNSYTGWLKSKNPKLYNLLKPLTYIYLAYIQSATYLKLDLVDGRNIIAVYEI